MRWPPLRGQCQNFYLQHEYDWNYSRDDSHDKSGIYYTNKIPRLEQ